MKNKETSHPDGAGNGVITDIEQADLRLGYMALTDCAPLIVAKRRGLFEKYGLKVRLCREGSWATLRDKVLAGVLDGAQMLAPLPITQTLEHPQSAIVTGMVLSRNGNAVTLSQNLLEAWTVQSKLPIPIPFMSAEALTDFVAFVTQKSAFRIGVVHQHACHHYQVLDWLSVLPSALRAKCQISVIPPVAMVDALATGEVHGFCVGAPWNAAAVRQGVGITVATSLDIWGDHPEKVLGVRAAWHHANPGTHCALICALIEAQRWLQSAANRFEVACWLTSKSYLAAPLEVIAPALLESCLTHEAWDPRDVAGYLSFDAEGRQSMLQDAQWLLDKTLLYGEQDFAPVASTLIENIYLHSFNMQARTFLGKQDRQDEH